LNEVDTPFTPSQGQRRIDRSYAEDVRGWQGQREILEALDGLVGRIPPVILLATCLVIAAVPGLLDRDLADGFSISIFYLVAVAVAAWYGGGRLGYSMAGVSALAKQRDELRNEVATLTEARDAQTKLAAERDAQVKELAQAKESAEKVAAERQAQIESLTKARDEQTRLAEERQARIEELMKSSATSAGEKSEIERQNRGAKKPSHGTPAGT
jgi:hypothetical protein